MIYTVTEEKEEKSGEEQPGQTSSPSDAAWNGERGRIDKAMLEKHLSDNDLKDSIFYICGPPVMIKAMQNLIQNERYMRPIKEYQ